MLRAALDGVDAGRLVQRALENPDIVKPLQTASAVDVIAAGKAAAVMLNAFEASTGVPVRRALGIGPQAPDILPAGAEWHDAGHPLPTDGSVAGARRALDIAAALESNGLLVVLLSGGGSSLMALPAEGLTLADKAATARQLMAAGADIYELNTVRKHLSAIKGGRLAAAARGSVMTLAVSDVVGDDLSVIASGPTVADASTFDAALRILDRRGGRAAYPAAVVARLGRGARGEVPETPKAGDPGVARSIPYVIGPQRGAIEGAQAAAMSRGYHVRVLSEPVTGEARTAAAVHAERVARLAADAPRPLCVIAAGETTVTVTGRGKGGRNQEFALALGEPLTRLIPMFAAASIGTDGIDGPTDAAGAMVDPDTRARASRAGITTPDAFLDDNDTYTFFDRTGDLIRTGPTNTNVGDLQVVLIA